MPGQSGTNDLVRLCVRSMVRDGGGDDSAAVSRAFAVCTANFQKHGYMRGGSLTNKGKKRLALKKKGGDFKGKLKDYEKVLDGARAESVNVFALRRRFGG